MRHLDAGDLQVRHVMNRDPLALDAGAPIDPGRLWQVRHAVPVVDGERRVVGTIGVRHLLRAAPVADATERTDRARPHDLAGDLAAAPRLLAAASDSAVALARRMLAAHVDLVPVIDRRRHLVGAVTEADFLPLAARLLAREPPPTVGELMTRDPITVGPDGQLGQADTMMAVRRFHHLPVVDADGALVGLVAHHDLLRWAEVDAAARAHFPPDLALEDVMGRDPWTIDIGAAAVSAVGLLVDERCGALPVVDHGRVVGILTPADLLRWLVGQLDHERTLGWRDLPVNYYMSGPLATIGSTATLADAGRRLVDARISGLVVVDDGVMVGVLSATDLVAFHTIGHTVVSAMTRDVVTVPAHLALPQAARTLIEREIHRAVVVEGARPVGIFSRSDAVLAVRDLGLTAPLASFASPVAFAVDVGEPLAEARRLLGRAGVHGLLVRDGRWPVGVFGQLESLAAQGEPDDTPVERVMSAALVMLPADLPLCRAAAQLAALGARLAVVVAQDEVQGVASATDFTRACAELV